MQTKLHWTSNLNTKQQRAHDWAHSSDYELCHWPRTWAEQTHTTVKWQPYFLLSFIFVVLVTGWVRSKPNSQLIECHWMTCHACEMPFIQYSWVFSLPRSGLNRPSNQRQSICDSANKMRMLYFNISFAEFVFISDSQNLDKVKTDHEIFNLSHYTNSIFVF